MAPSSSSSPPVPAAAGAPVPLAPGFRFHPTDEELVSYYLRRRVLGLRLRLDAIAEVDLYHVEPWDLPSFSRIRSRDSQWYFFARLDRKASGAGAGGRGAGNRTNRATPRGYWKTTGKDREVSHRGRVVGMKKTLVFHSGRAPKGQRTNWVMHEYRLLDSDSPQDMDVVCRIFQKHGPGPQNGAQYGAPYMEEEWEEDNEVEVAGGATAAMGMMVGAGDEDSNEVDENGSMQMNDLAQNKDLMNSSEPALLPAQGWNETNDGTSPGPVVSLEEILKEPGSDGSVENIGRPGEQNDMDDNFSIADWSHCPSQNDGYADQNDLADPVYWNGSSNGDSTSWALRAYNKQTCVNGVDGRGNLQEILNVKEFFNNGDENNAQSGQSHVCPSYHDNSYLQANDLSAPLARCPDEQANDNMTFFDASSHDWVNGKEDFVNLNDLLYSPIAGSSFLDAEDDLMAYFDATDSDIKYDILGSVDKREGYDPQVTDLSNSTDKVDIVDGFATKGTSKTVDGNALCGASSSTVSPSDLCHSNSKANDAAISDLPRDDIVDKTFGKHLANMLGSIAAPPALAAEFPAATGKSVGPTATAQSSSSIRITAGMIQISGLTLAGSAGHFSSQKNADLDFLLSFSMAGDVSTKSVGFEPNARMHGGVISVALRGGFYLFFFSMMILAVSYKVGLCVRGR